jgi:hypothetical protein
MSTREAERLPVGEWYELLSAIVERGEDQKKAMEDKRKG